MEHAIHASKVVRTKVQVKGQAKTWSNSSCYKLTCNNEQHV